MQKEGLSHANPFPMIIKVPPATKNTMLIDDFTHKQLSKEMHDIYQKLSYTTEYPDIYDMYDRLLNRSSDSSKYTADITDKDYIL